MQRMNTYKIGFLLAALTPVLVVGQGATNGNRASAAPRQDSANELSVGVGKSVVLDCAQPVERVVVGLGGIAEAAAISPVEILVNGKAPGETSLILWEKGGNREFFNVVVRPGTTAASDRLDVIRRELKRQLPEQQIKVTGENGAVFLSGIAKDLTSSDRAVQIASVGGKVVNLLNVQVPAAESQILLKVVFASVDRSKSNQLGLNLFSTGFGNVIGAVSTGQFSAPALGTSGGASGASLSSDLNLFAFLPGLNLGGTLKALETKGLVEVLAEPNLLAENGKQASFLAGGEYPYPVVQGTGSGLPSVSIQFKQYGVRLNFIPTITPGGNIRLQVAPEVSALDFANAVQVSGFNVPAISVRRVRTEIELSKGQSFAISGLLDNRETQTFEKVPFLGDVPILGRFFQSIDKTKSNTELIVIVTPQIVDPVPAGAPLPTPNFPVQFLPPNSNTPMQTPESAAASTPTAPAAIPVEKLIDSMKPEQPLVIDSGYSAGAGGSFGGGGGNGASAGAAPSAPQ
jgi:pilus assembly protein CpaC